MYVAIILSVSVYLRAYNYNVYRRTRDVIDFLGKP